MDARGLDRTRDGHQLASGGKRGFDDLLEVRVAQLAAHHHGPGLRRLEQECELAHLSQRAGRRRVGGVDEAHRAVFAVVRERRTRRHAGALARRAHEERVHRHRGRPPQPRHQAIDRQPLCEDRHPHRERRQRVLHEYGCEPARPYRRPQRQRRGQRARREQSGGVASPVARPVTAGDEEAEHQRHGKLPAVQVPARQRGANRVTEGLAGERTVLQQAEHGAHEREDGEVGSDQHGKAGRGTAGVVA